jgi:hypothetical protein
MIFRPGDGAEVAGHGTKTDPHARPLTWMFDREIRGPAGRRDVRFRPSATRSATHGCVMVLDSPKGYAVVSFDAVEMTFFLLAIDQRASRCLRRSFRRPARGVQ